MLRSEKKLCSTLLYTFANRKGADQPVSLQSLISAIAIHFLGHIMTQFSPYEESIF